MANKPTLANGPPGESRIHALNISTQNMADEHILADGPPPSESRIDALNTTTPNFGRRTYFGRWTPYPPSESRIDALNISTQNLADEHTLADGPLPVNPE